MSYRRPPNVDTRLEAARPPLVLHLGAITAADLPQVGGKGANLGELTRAAFRVPPGFCLTTEAFQCFLGGAATEAESNIVAADRTEVADALRSFTSVDPRDLASVRSAGERVRGALRRLPVPTEVAEALREAWQATGTDHAYAVRSSATAEDLPDASFAGQQDTFLNVRGEDALRDAVRECWVSLFTDRAITYRAEHGFTGRDVAIAVVVQRMVEPTVSGILFTADPVSGNRDVLSIDASFGLGEALVSGIVTADLYRVSKLDGEVLERHVADKTLRVRALAAGGVETVYIDEAERQRPALDDGQLQALLGLGVAIEDHFGRPQDIEWAFPTGPADPAGPYVLQARPITSLFPLPAPRVPGTDLRAYLSFGHVQVMTDPMSEMGRSLWQVLVPFGRPDAADDRTSPYVASAAGRIYLDMTAMLRHPLGKRLVPRMARMADPQIGAALATLAARDDLQRGGRMSWRDIGRWLLPIPRGLVVRLLFAHPEGAPRRLLDGIDAFVRGSASRIESAPPGAARLRLARDVLAHAFETYALPLPSYFGAGGVAQALLRRLLPAEAHHSDLTALQRGLDGNVTTEMDLAVGDLADAARSVKPLAAVLEQPGVDVDTVLREAAEVPGSGPFLTAWQAFVQRYGMRGPSEIDVARPRWSEDATSLLRMLVGNLSHDEDGAHRDRHRQLAAAGEAARTRLLAAAGEGPLGWLRRPLARRLLRVARTLPAVREHPKYLIVSLFAVAKSTVIAEARRLMNEGRLQGVDDVWHLSLGELIAMSEQPSMDVRHVVAERRDAFQRYGGLQPPRVMTSRGEIVTGAPLMDDAPAGALAGTPVSAGVVEGLARVVLDPTQAALAPGEILIAPFTDPGWTPLFVQAAGLVTEVGGLMTHGSVVAREYGIPAVVGVAGATQRIDTGQRVRIDGTSGLVQRLDGDGSFRDADARR